MKYMLEERQVRAEDEDGERRQKTAAVAKAYAEG
jgi:hypothetical protein